MAEVGLHSYHLHELDRQIEKGKPDCYSAEAKAPNSKFGGIELQEALLAFSSVGLGFLLAVTAFVVELAVARRWETSDWSPWPLLL